jgi:uncharacterized protein YyaL (SSP411 family)
MSNKLNKENSPYLLQHAENPVNWFPWSNEVFTIAKEKNVPIFLSIGYSTCHWCHVMEKESFEDEEIAKILNSNFISIKVDREQRPDLDSIYMAVCQMMTNRGGWPLTIIMTPDKIPFFAGTYFPKISRNGLVGLLDLLPKVREAWNTKREDVIRSGESILASLKDVSNPTIPDSFIVKDDMEEIFESLKDFFDEKFGGFGEAPKFPSPQNMIFLSKFYLDTKNKDSLRMIDQTLTSMRLGGIYDHVGYGFHRYSTDVKWLVPHFEKMLYDQAMILEALAEAYKVTKKDLFKETAEEIHSYLNEILLSNEGGFFSAEDADSEGEEGTFYLWTLDELKKLLTSDEYAFFEHLYNIEAEGNFIEETTKNKNGKNIIFLKDELDSFSSTFSLNPEMIKSEAKRIKQKIKNERDNRVRPSLDDKILTDWNGLTISSLAKAWRIFKNPIYLDTAMNGFEFIKTNMVSEDYSLFHCYRNGHVAIKGLLDDYSFLTKGCIDLYESTLDSEILTYGVGICKKMVDLFWDKERGSFFMTRGDDVDIIVRQKNLLDGAIPSGNSVALYDLVKIGNYTNDEQFNEKAKKLSSQLGAMAKKFPINLGQFLANHYSLLSENIQIVILNKGKKPNFKNDVVNYLLSFEHPNKSIFYVSSEKDKKIYNDILLNSDFIPDLTDEFQIFICKDYTCNLPVSSLREIKEILE